MYRVLIPVYNNPYTPHQREILVRELKKANPDLILLTFGRVLRNQAMLDEEKAMFIKTKEYLEAHGLKVGAWLAPTIGYGGTGTKSSYDNDADEVYTKIRHFNDKELFSYCPLDDAFTDDLIHTIHAICSTGIEFLLFEDDFTISGGKSYDFGCACERHMALYRQLIGREVSYEEMKTALYEGGPNELRLTWQKAIRTTMRGLAEKIDREVHALYPNVRIGLSANSSSYNLEGAPLPELARIIAGKNRPFIRLTGAPYWQNALTFATNVEAIRLQAHWCTSDIELVTEGDTFPRPRHWVPANLLEHYDMMTRASGTTDGILKYMVDYAAAADFESGYIERHRRNTPHYEEIERRFANKRAVGVNIFERMGLITDLTFTENFSIRRFCRVGRHLPTMSQEICMDACLPTAYGDGESASVVFGENAYAVTDEMRARGLVLDATAARILTEQGIDVGIRASRPCEAPAFEHFIKEDERYPATTEEPADYFEFTLDESADVISTFVRGSVDLGSISSYDTQGEFPACYFYENKNGERFVVYSFVANTVRVKKAWFRGLFRNYYRQNQLIEQIERLQGHPLPAVCKGNPQLYVLCKKDEDSMAVGLWNSFADEVLDPVVVLDQDYRSIDFYHCSGHLEGRRVMLDGEIPPFGFAFFTVYR